MKTTKTNKANLNKSRIAKRTKTLFGILFFSLLILTSCKKKDEQEDNTVPDGAALASLFEDNRTDAMQSFTVDMDGGAEVIGNKGTVVTFPANSVGLNGTPVTGNITVELIEVYDKGAMLLQNMPTSGKKSNGDEEALISAGEFFLNAKQGGNQLEILIPIQIQSKGIEPALWEPMQVFKAGEDMQDIEIWEEVKGPDGNNQNAEGGEGQGPDGEFVMFSVFDTSSFGWTNLDIWWNYTGTLTDIFVDVPDGFDGDNCEVYLSYDGEPNALARMDIYNSTTELFTEHFGRIPVGQEIHVILIAEVNGELVYSIEGRVVGAGAVIDITTTQPTTQAALETIINALP